ncbi:MAG: UDP-N-acetylglucosamine 1-carboxyvinyltransferase [Proteobacteria bacterium]|nr:MAG: UDP-N-acetylglucosamine 1-carboxyvinyltransferase [Pseudomonadota bacterium]
MDYFVIRGGQPLQGRIAISGAKNAALPILAASLLTSEELRLQNVPHLNDITTMIELLGALGAEVAVDESGSLCMTAAALSSRRAPYELVKTMRASILVMGPLLARFGRAEVSFPGGCAIGSRPVDLHLKGFEAMGAQIDVRDGYIVATTEGGLRGCDFTFEMVTVGGTENLLMAAVLAEGKTVLRNVAREPEITDLVRFLRAMGADISGDDTDTLVIQGVRSLRACEYAVMPDRIEAGTYLVAAAATGGCITVEGANAEHLGLVLDKLREAGVDVRVDGDAITADMSGKRPLSVDVITAPYPGFPTDMQAQFTALNLVADGVARITETIFENRLIHAQEMSRMGANITIDGHSVIIRGQEEISGAPVMASDLRASASLVIAGLAAKGETRVDRIYHIDRGYERIEEKLQSVGADIVRKMR